MDTKTCRLCGVAKPLSDFSVDSRRNGARTSRGGKGVASQCKHCLAERRKPGIHAERETGRRLAAAGLKRCASCREIKPVSDFHVRRASRDGLAYKCAACVKQACREWKTANPDAFREWYKKNADKQSRKYKEYREANIDALKLKYREWAQRNPDKINSRIAKRSAAKLRATPSWADREAMRDFYRLAAKLTRETGVRHEVDHIVPLQGKSVCGLHWEGNLQVLPKTENIRKSNRLHEEWNNATSTPSLEVSRR
jgi:hypothetical protein